MAKRVQRLGHLGAQAAQFIGYEREITVDVTKGSLRVHDNQTPGGIEIARADADNIQEAVANTQDGKMTAAQAQQLLDNAADIADLQQSVGGYIQIPVVGNINITPEQAANAVIELVGTISNYINVIFPDAETVNYIKNSTAGGHSLRCYAQSSTTFVEVKNGEIRGIYYDSSGATLEPKDIVGADASQVYYDNAVNSSLYSKLGQDALDELSRGTRQNFSVDVAGGVDVTLTDEQAAYYVLTFTGALTANINVIVPDREKPYFITNDTTGDFTLTMKTALGGGVEVVQNDALVSLYCDGASVYPLAQPKGVINVLSPQFQISDVETNDVVAGVLEAMLLANLTKLPLYFPSRIYAVSKKIPFKASVIGASMENAVIRAHSTFPVPAQATFNGTSVDIGLNTISIPGHPFSNEDVVLYDAAGGTSIAGYEDRTHYFIIVNNIDSVKLAATEEDAKNGVEIDITAAGVGTGHTLTRKLMLLDFNDGKVPFENLGNSVKNLTFDGNQRPGVAAFSSSSPGGAGGGGSPYFENVKLIGIHFDTYPIEAYTTEADNVVAETGMLSYATVNNLLISSELFVNIGWNQVRTVFNSPVFQHKGPNVGSETKACVRINGDGTLFKNIVLDSVQNIGYSFMNSYVVTPLIEIVPSLSNDLNSLYYETEFRGISVLTSAGISNLTCIFAARGPFNLRVRDLKVGVADSAGNARCILHVDKVAGFQRSYFDLEGLMRSRLNTNPFRRLIESDRGVSSAGANNQIVTTTRNISSNANIHEFPFTTLEYFGNKIFKTPIITWYGSSGDNFHAISIDEGNSNPYGSVFKPRVVDFDASAVVDTVNNQLNLTAHEIETGDCIFYDRYLSSDTLIGGLTAKTQYYGIRISADIVALATTQANAFAGTKAPLTAAGTGIHFLNRRYYTSPRIYTANQELELISSVDVKAATFNTISVIDFVGLGEFDTYKLVIEQGNPFTPGGQLCLRFSADNGSSFFQGATDYAYGIVNASAQASFISLGASQGGSPFSAFRGEIFLYLKDRTWRATMYGTLSYRHTNGNYISQGITGLLQLDQLVNALRLYYDNSNFNFGKAHLYGVRK